MSIAEDHYSGACCVSCSYYFHENEGVPAMCEECYDEAPKQEQKTNKRHKYTEEEKNDFLYE